MDPTAAIELFLLLLVIATGLAFVARRIGVAYPIVLVLGGLVLGLVLTAVPQPPSVELPPNLVFLLFLPPILFGAAYFTPIRDFKANLRPIGLLAVGLVLFTTLVVGGVALALMPELGAAAFALGAIVAPPDAIAATAIFRRLGVPAAGRDDPRGREPRQRRDGADPLWRRAHRPPLGRVLGARGGGQLPRRGARRDRDRRRGRPRPDVGLAPDLRLDPRDRRVAPRSVRGLHPGCGDRGERRARGRHGRDHRRPASRPGAVTERPADGHRGLVGGPVHDQRVRLPFDRRPAAVDPRRAARPIRRSGSSGSGSRSARRRSSPGSCGSSRPPTCRAGRAPSCAHATHPRRPARCS